LPATLNIDILLCAYIINDIFKRRFGKAKKAQDTRRVWFQPCWTRRPGERKPSATRIKKINNEFEPATLEDLRQKCSSIISMVIAR
jgi:hypothetical protein